MKRALLVVSFVALLCVSAVLGSVTPTTSDFILYNGFNESSSVYVDLKNVSLNYSKGGGYTTAAGKFGSAVSFAGGSSSNNASAVNKHNFNFTSTSSYTIGFWAMINGTVNRYPGLVQFHTDRVNNPNGDGLIFFYREDTRKFYFSYHEGDTLCEFYPSVNLTVTAGTWNLFGVNIDFATNNMTYYLNGTAAGYSHDANCGGNLSAANRLGVDIGLHESGVTMNGSIDELFVLPGTGWDWSYLYNSGAGRLFNFTTGGSSPAAQVGVQLNSPYLDACVANGTARFLYTVNLNNSATANCSLNIGATAVATTNGITSNGTYSFNYTIIPQNSTWNVSCVATGEYASAPYNRNLTVTSNATFNDEGSTTFTSKPACFYEWADRALATYGAGGWTTPTGTGQGTLSMQRNFTNTTPTGRIVTNWTGQVDAGGIDYDIHFLRFGEDIAQQKLVILADGKNGGGGTWAVTKLNTSVRNETYVFPGVGNYYMSASGQFVDGDQIQIVAYWNLSNNTNITAEWWKNGVLSATVPINMTQDDWNIIDRWGFESITSSGSASNSKYAAWDFNLSTTSPPPGTVNSYLVSTYDLYDNSELSGVLVTLGGSSNTTNATGDAYFYNKTGTQNYNATKTGYYGLSLSVAANGSSSANMSMANYSLSVTKKVTGAAVAAFNFTLGKAYVDPLLVYARSGLMNYSFVSAGYHSRAGSFSVSSSTPLTGVVNVSNVTNTYWAFSAVDAVGGGPVTTFNVTANNTVYGYSERVVTTNGSALFSLLQNVSYTFLFEAPLFGDVNVTFSPANYSGGYEFSASVSPSINITIRDGDGVIIAENVSVSLTGNDSYSENATVTGSYWSGGVSSGSYVVRLESANYSTGTYIVTLGEDDSVFLDAYLLNTSDSVVFEFVDSTASSVTLPGVLVTQQRFINGSWATVNMKLTDITGRTTFGYEAGVAYRFIAVMVGYVSKTFDLDPVLYASYQIRMTRNTLLDFNQDFQSVSIAYTPKIFFEGNNTLNISFSSPIGVLANYSYLLRYPGGSNTGNGSTATGETFSVPFTISGAVAGSLVNITLFYTATQGGLHQFSYAHEIIVAPGNTTFISNLNNTYGMGLLDRVIIGTFIIILVAGLATIGAGSILGAGVGLLLMGLFLFMGFWPWWAAGLSILVGFALLSKRTV